MEIVDDVFAAFGGAASLARAIDIEPFHAQTMKTRGRIPVTYWPRLVRAAKQRGIRGLSYEILVRLHAPDDEAQAS